MKVIRTILNLFLVLVLYVVLTIGLIIAGVCTIVTAPLAAIFVTFIVFPTKTTSNINDITDGEML